MIGASMGIDYPFAAFIGILVLALGWVGLVRIPMRRLFLIVALAIGLPFVLRQIQVAAVLGGDFWWADFVYSVLRRMPLASVFVAVPDSVTLSKYYDAHGVIKWPGGGGPVILLTWAFVFVRAHVATLGLPSLALGLAALWAIWLRRRVQGPMGAGLALLAAVGLAIAATLLVFGEYLSIFYGVILMPLGVHAVVLLLGLTSYGLIAHRRCTMSFAFGKGNFAIPVGAILLTIFVLWRVGTEVRNVHALPPAGYPGRHALAELGGHSVATLWISSAPSAYTDQWAATLQTMRFLVKSPRRFEFTPDEDYYMFFERDRDNPRYRRPDFLLIPRLHVWGLTLLCQPFSGWVVGFADGCTDLAMPATQLERTSVPLYRRGEDYLIYDLRRLRRD